MAIVDRPAVFSTLARGFYLDPDLLEAEASRIWYREWLYLAHESEIPKVGDFVVREMLGESIIVVRTSKTDVRAMLNVCRHRGARIVDAPCGTAKRFSCPYHQWTYGLDGTLRTAPSMPDEIELAYGELGLHNVAVDVWRGLIFGCLGSEPPPTSIAQEIERCSPALAQYSPDRMRKVEYREYPVAANWKVLMENYCECYHCRGSHPEFCRTADLTVRSQPDYQQRSYSTEPYWNLDTPLRTGAKSASMSGDHVVRRLLVDPADDQASGVSRGFVIQPAFTVMYFYADYAMVHEIRPVSATETRFHIHWFVSDEATDEDFALDELTHVWDATTRQDVALVERSQRGIGSRRYRPGPLSVEQEPGIRAVLETYIGLMRGDQVFETLSAEAA
jgi:phenylpropionate dioxygenase-like ring-hydroxylating dioxygenase large terminal subunit